MRAWKAWGWFLAMVVGVELALHGILPSRVFTHEVDRLVYDVSHERFDADVVVLGDSVANGLFRHIELPPGRAAVLTGNQAIETAGQYFLLRRYLENNVTPRAVVYGAIDPRSGDLNQPLTENYVQRCFTRWREIGACAWGTRDLAFGARMMAYKLLASFRYRTVLQRRLTGMDDTDLRRWKRTAPAAEAPGEPRGLCAVVQSWARHRRGERLSPRYLRLMIEELERRGVDPIYLPVPTSPANEDHCRRLFERLAVLEDEHPRFRVAREAYRTYPPEFFCDGWHLNERGRDAHRDVLLKALHDHAL
jgi:hypothetical protein